MIYGIARDKSLPKFLSAISSKRKVPRNAILSTLVLALLLLPLGKVEIVASVSSLATMIAFFTVNLTLIILRYAKPEIKRPFRVPLNIGNFPIIPMLGALGSLFFALSFSWQVYLVVASFVALIGLVHLIRAR